MKNILLKIMLPLLLLTAIMSCQQETPSSAENISTADPSPATEKMSVNLNEAQQKLAGIETDTVGLHSISKVIECSGQIDVPPQYIHSVHAPVIGFVQTVPFLEGDYVKKEALLTQLSHPELVRLQRDFLEVHSRLEFLQKDYERKETLVKGDAGSQKAYEEAKALYFSTLAQFKGLAAELDLVGFSSEQLRKTGTIQSQLRLYAPSSGYLSKVFVNPGKLVHPDDQLYQIIDTRHLHLELQVFAKDLPLLEKGQRVEARLPGNQATISARIHLVGKTIDLDQRTARIHAHLDPGTSPLAVGTYLPSRIFVTEKKVPAVPTTALVREGSGQYLFIKKPEGFRKIEVQTGGTDGGYTELNNWDYPPDTEVVVRGAYYIQEGEE